jgi:exopolysaccharide production protein ExoQ
MTMTEDTVSGATGRAHVTTGAGLLNQLLLGYLLLLLTGALQRPLGGGDLQGTMTGVVITSGNPLFKVVLAGTIGLVLFILAANLGRLRLPARSGYVLAFNAFAFFSVLWSPQPGTTFQSAVGLGFSTLVAIHATSFFTWVEVSRILVRVMVILVLVTGFLALVTPGYAFHSTHEFFYMHAGLLKGTYVHKNALGVALTLALIVLVTLGRAVLGRWTWLGTITLAFYLIMLTGSAKSFVSVPAALLIGYGAAATRNRLAFWSFSAYFAAVITLLVIFGGAETFLADTTEALGRDVTMSGRTLIWQSAIDYTINSGHWLAGGGFEAAWPGGIGEYVQQTITFDPGHPHNGFIAIFDDLGLIGLVLILFGVVRVINQGLAHTDDPRRRRFVLSMLVMIVVTNTAGTSLPMPVSLSWFLFAILPAVPSWRSSGETGASLNRMDHRLSRPSRS